MIVKTESGCKVGWTFFDNEEEARAYSPKAYADGVKAAAEGYDFGYQTPGEVQKVSDNLWRVTTR